MIKQLKSIIHEEEEVQQASTQPIYIEASDDVASDSLLTVTFRAIKENKYVRDNNPMDIIFSIGYITDHNINSIINLFEEIVRDTQDTIRGSKGQWRYRDFTFDICHKDSDEVITISFENFKKLVKGINNVVSKLYDIMSVN